MQRRQRVLFVALYPESQAGTRLRALAWFPELEAHGFDCTLWSFVRAKDSATWFGRSGGPHRVVITALGLIRAVVLWARLPHYDVVVVLREAVPVATTFIERRAATRCRLVWDVDDALWVSYPRMFLTRLPDRLRRSEAKYARLAGLAHEVWAGGSEIANWCRRHNDAVWLLPTVPATPTTVPGLEGRVGIVWVGSQSTAPFLEQVLAHLDPLPDGVCITVVGAEGPSLHDARVRWLQWSEEAEVDALRAARVGLYPLDTAHPLASPRAGFKAALYMAHGVPSVATPIPAVTEMLRHDVEGFHASTPSEWASSVRRLLIDDTTWTRLSTAGRRRAEAAYATAAWAPRVAERVAALLHP